MCNNNVLCFTDKDVDDEGSFSTAWILEVVNTFVHGGAFQSHTQTGDHSLSQALSDYFLILVYF